MFQTLCADEIQILVIHRSNPMRLNHSPKEVEIERLPFKERMKLNFPESVNVDPGSIYRGLPYLSEQSTNAPI